MNISFEYFISCVCFYMAKSGREILYIIKLVLSLTVNVLEYFQFSIILEVEPDTLLKY